MKKSKPAQRASQYKKYDITDAEMVAELVDKSNATSLRLAQVEKENKTLTDELRLIRLKMAGAEHELIRSAK